MNAEGWFKGPFGRSQPDTNSQSTVDGMARLSPGCKGEQPLAGHQRGGLASQPVGAHPT
jgi:hypothetical protein